MFETWSVGFIYRFVSNAKAVLGETAVAADKATVALDRYTTAMRLSQQTAAGFMRNQARLRSSLGLTATSAQASAARVDGSYASMAAASSRATGTMIAEARALRAQYAGIGASATAAAGRVRTFQSGVGRFASRAADVGAIGSLGVMGIGVKTAADIQASAAQSGVAMGLSTDTVQRLFVPIAMRMSNITAQSAAQSMSLLNVMATSGINNPTDLLRDNGALPMAIARFADTQYLGKHNVAFDESATQAVQIAHQFGARTSRELTPILNTLFKISQDMPDSLRTAATQLKYYASTYVGQGRVDPATVLMMQATADRMGFGGGKSGTGFNMIYRSMLKPTSKAARAAQERLGLLDGGGNNRFIDKATGAFDVQGLFAHLNQVYHQSGRAGNVRGFERDLQSAMPSNAALIAAMMSSDAGRKQYKAVMATMKRVPDLEKAQAQLMDTLNGQYRRLITNVANLASVLGGPLIRPLTDMLRHLGDATGNATEYLRRHPTQTKVAAGVLAAGGLYGAYRIMTMGTEVIRGFMSHGRVGLALSHSIGSRRAGHAALELGETVGRDVVGRGGGLVPRIARALWDVATFPQLRSMLGGAWHGAGSLIRGSEVGKNFMAVTRGSSWGNGLVRMFESMGMKARGARAGIGMLSDALQYVFGAVFKSFGGFVFKLGARAIPLVGELLLVIDTLKFLGAHAKDVGKLIGIAAHWIVTHGGPLLVSAVKEVWGYIVDTVKFLFNGIKDSVVGLFNGGNSGIFKWVQDVAKSAVQSYQAADAADRAPHKNGPTNPHARSSARGVRHGGAHAASSSAPRVSVTVGQIVLPPGTPAQHADNILDVLHRKMQHAVDAHGDDVVALLDPRPRRGSMAPA